MIFDPRDVIEANRNAIQVNPEDFFAYYNLARAHQYQGNFQEAALALQKAVLLNPTDPYGQHSLGEIFLKLDQSEEARLCFLRALAQNTDFLPAYFSLARLLIQQGQLEESIPKLKKVIQLQPTFHHAYKYLAEVYLGIKFYREALEAISKAVELVPGNFFYQRLKGEICIELGDSELAKSCFRKANNLNLEDRYSLIKYAELLFDSGEWLSCSKRVKQALEIEPLDSKALMLLGLCHLKMLEIQEAFEAFSKVQRVDPLCEEVNLYLAEIFCHYENWSEVQRYLTLVPIRLKKSVVYIKCLASLARSQGNHELARKNLENLLVHPELEPAFVLQLAGVYRDEAKAREAYGLLEDGIQKFGERYDFLEMMAQLMDQLGDHEKAGELIRRMSELAPSDSQAEKSELIITSYQNVKESRIKELGTLLKLEPDNLEINLELGDLYFELGELEKASNQWKIAYANDPKCVEVLIRLAEIERQKGDIPSSLNHLKNAQYLNPNDLDLFISESRLLFETGQLVEARELLMQVRKDFPEDILPLLFLLRIARFQDDQDEMLSLSNELMQLEPNHYYSCLVLGILSLKRDDVARADEYFSKAIESSGGNDKEPIYYLGIVKKIQGDLRHAYRCFSRVLDLYPEDAYAHYHIGLILKLRGNHIMAEKHLISARDLDPEDLFTRQHLAMLYYEQRNWQLCLEELLDALTLDENDFVTNLYLGQAFYEKKSFEKSVLYLRRAQVANPSDPNVHYQLALAYLELKQNKNAEICLENGLPLCSRESNLYLYSKELLSRLRS